MSSMLRTGVVAALAAGAAAAPWALARFAAAGLAAAAVDTPCLTLAERTEAAEAAAADAARRAAAAETEAADATERAAAAETEAADATERAAAAETEAADATERAAAAAEAMSEEARQAAAAAADAQTEAQRQAAADRAYYMRWADAAGALAAAVVLVSERVPEDRLPSLSAAAPGRVSGELASAVDAALAVDRRDRPQSLAAWSALLAGSVEHRERRSRRAGTGESRDRESRRDRSREGDSTRRWWLAGAGATALAGAVLVAALAGPWQGTVSDDEGDETRVVEDTATSPSGEPEDGAVVEGESGGEAGGGETAAVVDEGVVDEGVAAEERSPSPSAVEEALGLGAAARGMVPVGLLAPMASVLVVYGLRWWPSTSPRPQWCGNGLALGDDEDIGCSRRGAPPTL